jgi:DNA-binding LacI/PurR family transcriptional regulator
VSRALTPGASIAQKTREKVMAAAAELGYQPNLMARSLMTRQTRLIALVMAQLRNPFFTDMLGLFNRYFQVRGYQTLLLAVEGEQGVDEVLESVFQYQPDGAVLVSCTPSLALAERCARDGMPLVIIDRGFDSAVDAQATHVWIRSDRLGAEIAECLLAEGRRRVALVEGYAGEPPRERARSFMERMLRASGVSVQVEHGQYTYEGGYAAGLRLLRSASPPDAVFCISDPMALGLVDAARLELGLRVPEDLSVVGFSDIPAARWASHALTTVRLPITELVDHAAAALLERLESPETPARTLLLDCPLIRRGTTLPQP